MPSTIDGVSCCCAQTWQARCSATFVTNNSRNDLPTSTSEFYTEKKWCDDCDGYVRFMMSVNHSYCIECGGRVRLFNRNDSANFQDTVQRHKWQAS
tara:strand:+ start:483 stop:770 length:288 start_codon:yes stop_codon:yes gene_type:complete